MPTKVIWVLLIAPFSFLHGMGTACQLQSWSNRILCCPCPVRGVVLGETSVGPIEACSLRESTHFYGYFRWLPSLNLILVSQGDSSHSHWRPAWRWRLQVGPWGTHHHFLSYLEFFFLLQNHVDPVWSPPGKVLPDWSCCEGITGLSGLARVSAWLWRIAAK